MLPCPTVMTNNHMFKAAIRMAETQARKEVDGEFTNSVPMTETSLVNITSGKTAKESWNDSIT